jgi:hypothetical protein
MPRRAAGDGLEAVSVWLKGGIPTGEKWSKDFNVILGPYLVGKLREAHLHFPANVFPILPCVPEFLWLWAFPAIRLSNPNSEDSGVDEGENEIARRDLAHGLVKGISRTVDVAFGRPNITAPQFVAVGLVLVDPPKAHICPTVLRMDRVIRGRMRRSSFIGKGEPEVKGRDTLPVWSRGGEQDLLEAGGIRYPNTDQCGK